MRELKFGVEIEFFGCRYRTVIQALNFVGIACTYEGYTHTVMSSWKLVTDSSVNGFCTGVDGGLELVSPILYGDEGLAELEKVYDVLNIIGAKVDRTCGTHVHFDIADLNVNQIKSVYNLTCKYEDVIDMMLPESRRENEYCQGLTNSQLKKINKCTTLSELNEVGGKEEIGRYVKVNFASYIKYGTIEFRQHEGTTEFEKIKAWIVLNYTILNYCSMNTVDRPSRKTSKHDINELINLLNMNDTCVGDYLIERHRHFMEVC